MLTQSGRKLVVFKLSLQDQSVRFVIDGGALLQRLPWKQGVTYNSICESYVHYVERHFGKQVAVVFDGYQDGPSTKDPTHLRRRTKGVGPEVKLRKNAILSHKKDVFLSNDRNKHAFLLMLGEKLQQSGCTVHHATADADLLIVKTALECVMTSDTVVIGDDTDLLILLCYHSDPHSTNTVYLKPQQKRNNKEKGTWNIKLTREKLGNDICDNILALHALLGCDTTSRLFGMGKGTVIKKFESNTTFASAIRVFNDSHVSRQQIINAGERALVALYNGDNTCTLDDLRFQKFHQKVLSSSKACDPKALPPTSAAAKNRSMRVYCQVLQWKGISVNPQDWGWDVTGDKLFPCQTDRALAPKDLLEVIWRKCKTGCS